MAPGETPGAVCRGGRRRAQSSRAERRLSRLRIGVASSAYAGGPSGLSNGAQTLFDSRYGRTDRRLAEVTSATRARRNDPDFFVLGVRAEIVRLFHGLY